MDGFSKLRIVALLIALGSITTLGLAREAPPNLLLITVDTFRADHLGADDSGGSLTPNLDRLAGEGANFTRARASVPLTLPSHASILTGTYPHTHGLRDNGVGPLDADSVTLAEALAESGYATAAFVASFVLDRRFGLDQGFDLYDDRVTDDLSKLEDVEAERDGATVVAALESWLEDRSDRGPFFVWLHLYDPHAPYIPPEPYRSRYRQDPYSGEIAYTDELIGRALAALESRELLANTIVAVVGDHGEGLGEHREMTHSLLIYNSTLHVPMLIWAPGLVPSAEVTDLVRSIDLAPTILDYLGRGGELGEGTSLRGHIGRRGDESGPAPPELSAVSESLYGQIHLGWSPLFALERGRYRLILAPEPELYDLVLDPAELDNRFTSDSETAAELSGILTATIRVDSVAAEDSATGNDAPGVDSETAARLRSLGYLSGAAVDPRIRSTADPKKKIEIWEQLQEGIALYGRGQYEDAARSLERVVRGEREIPMVYEYLGSAYMRLERWRSVERLYEQALERGIETAAMQLDLGLIHSRHDAPEKAERALKRALTLDPSSVKALYHLGELYRATERPEAAEVKFREALAINPAYVFAWNALGRTRAASGRDAEALDAFERAVAIAPGEIRTALNLAVQLERMGREREALAAYERCLDLARREEPGVVREQVERALLRLRNAGS